MHDLTHIRRVLKIVPIIAEPYRDQVDGGQGGVHSCHDRLFGVGVTSKVIIRIE